MRSGGEVDRRSFLVGASAAEDPCDINCWVSVAPDDTVTIRTAHAEMGQGAMTALAMLVAEELECDWNKVSTAFVSPGQNLRRNRARNADRRGGVALERAGLGVHRAKQRHHPYRERPQRHLRCRRRRRGQD